MLSPVSSRGELSMRRSYIWFCFNWLSLIIYGFYYLSVSLNCNKNYFWLFPSWSALNVFTGITGILLSGWHPPSIIPLSLILMNLPKDLMLVVLPPITLLFSMELKFIGHPNAVANSLVNHQLRRPSNSKEQVQARMGADATVDANSEDRPNSIPTQMKIWID